MTGRIGYPTLPRIKYEDPVVLLTSTKATPVPKTNVKAARSFFPFIMAYSKQIGSSQTQDARRLENRRRDAEDRHMYNTNFSTFILCRYTSRAATLRMAT